MHYRAGAVVQPRKGKREEAERPTVGGWVSSKETDEDGQREPTRSWASAQRSAGMLDAQKMRCYWPGVRQSMVVEYDV